MNVFRMGHTVFYEKAYVNNKSSQIPSAISGFQAMKICLIQTHQKREYIIG